MKDKMEPITLDFLKSGSDLDGDCGSSPSIKPSWLDEQKFHGGQEFFEKNSVGITMSMHFSLVSGFVILNLLEPLVFTNHSDTPKKALRRYLSTARHIVSWCTDREIWDGGKNPGFESTQKVRKMHRSVAKAMNKKRGDKEYVSQYDMGLVQSGLMGAVVMYPSQFGVKCTESELEDYIHLWRGLGYLLGIDDRYNICSGSFHDTKNIVKEIEQKLLVPALLDRPEHFDLMSNAYCDGLNQDFLFPLTTREQMLALSYEAVGLPVPRLSIADTFRFYFLKFIMFVLYCFPLVHCFLSQGTEKRLKFMTDKLAKEDAAAQSEESAKNRRDWGCRRSAHPVISPAALLSVVGNLTNATKKWWSVL